VPGSIVSFACQVISAPCSQVSERRSGYGEEARVGVIASRTAEAPCLASAGPFFFPEFAIFSYARQVQEQGKARCPLHERADCGTPKALA
jgi:hypothetical protein